jgi:2-amino-4-hydroxy-6-hydroxymethyldihydropteridine diphosphokinase/dihydropteroate synthase
VNPSKWTPHSLSSSAFSESSLGASSIISKPEYEKHTAYIALGSNLGDRVNWIEKACNEMSARGIKVKRTSCLWETAPMYVLDQESFVNGACEVS